MTESKDDMTANYTGRLASVMCAGGKYRVEMTADGKAAALATLICELVERVRGLEASTDSQDTNSGQTVDGDVATICYDQPEVLADQGRPKTDDTQGTCVAVIEPWRVLGEVPDEEPGHGRYWVETKSGRVDVWQAYGGESSMNPAMASWLNRISGLRRMAKLPIPEPAGSGDE